MKRGNQTDLTGGITVLNAGGIVIYPTDTAFGIGCRIDNHLAVDRFFTLRRRPRTHATPLLVSDVEMSLAYFDSPSDIVRRLMKEYWPGALTIVAPCKKNLIYSPLRGDGNSVGLRMPDHEIPQKLAQAAGVPIIGSSANFHGKKTPYLLEDLDPELVALVDAVIPGTCRAGNVSTVVDCTASSYKILRQGAIELPPV